MYMINEQSMKTPAARVYLTDLCYVKMLTLVSVFKLCSQCEAEMIKEVIKLRLKEVEACIGSKAPLASILLIGSIMEGVLLGMATTYHRQFNQAPSAPKDKDTGKVRNFPDWTLNNYIEVAFEVGLLKQDVKKFSHVVRDFRNYIHPYAQMSSRFSPDEETALICFQVLKGAISQIGTFRKNQQGGQPQ